MTAKRSTISAILTLSLCLSMPAAAKAASAEEGVLRSAILYDISTMDVTETSDDYMIPMNVFDRLFETRMVDGEATLVNSLCTDWTKSDDGLTYNFVLRDGVVFSNGSALTASDVKYSFERLLIAAKQNTDIALEIAGAQALMDKEADSLEGLVVTDDTHFSITLSEANGGFLAELSSPAMSIVDAETMAEAKNFGKDPADTIGTGPYIVTEWIPNDHYTLEVNDKYWGDEPSAKKIIVSVEPDANTQNLMFQNGQLDMIDLHSQDSSIISSAYKQVRPDQIITTPMIGLNFLILNENKPYLSDVNVRKAIAMAIDVDTIIATLYDGDAIRQNGIIPTGIWAHNDDLKGVSYDPEAAQALLRESGYKDGEISFDLCMDSTANSTTQLMYQFISQQLSTIGITAIIQRYDHSSFIDRRMAGEIDAFIAHWLMDYNDPANIMYTFFGSTQNTAQRSINYPDTDIIDRVAAARFIVDDEEREKEYQALELPRDFRVGPT